MMSFSAVDTLLQPIRRVRRYLQLTPAAREEERRDRLGLPMQDPGVDRAIEAAVAWIGRAQDRSRSRDGGVARHFSLLTGWGTSYPETTGYLVPTMLAVAQAWGDHLVRQRARYMLDWLVAIQLRDGAFQAGTVDAQPIVPTVFNTGQVLLGLAAGVREFGDRYRDAMIRAADWLIANQDADGCWRKYPTPFAIPGEKAYETHVAWGLLEAARLEPQRGYAEAALANVRWALQHQRANGWFAHCCLTDPSKPLTHTLGYALRGLIEAFRFTRDPGLLQACRKTADGLLTALDPDGFLPGRLQADWTGAVPWACLTGTVQIASCWLLLYLETRNPDYLDAARRANRYVRRTVRLDGPPAIRGGIKGSFPISGEYGSYQYLNWAAKFFVDSNLLEAEVLSAE